MALRYSAKSARALAYLKSYYNDLEIFIEDSRSQVLLLRIIRRIIGTETRLKSLNLLGDRKTVLAACKLDQKDDDRKKLYVIDGDLDLIRGKAKRRLKHLYRLKSYCIENLLIRKSPLIEIALDHNGTSNGSAIEQRLAYDAWEKGIAQLLLPLFITYGIAQELGLGVPLVAVKVFTLCNSHSGQSVLDPKKVRHRIICIYREAMKKAPLKEIQCIRRRLQKNSKAGHNALCFISGKDYVFPLLQQKMRADVGFVGSVDHLKLRLALLYDVQAEPFFARRLVNLLRRT